MDTGAGTGRFGRYSLTGQTFFSKPNPPRNGPQSDVFALLSALSPLIGEGGDAAGDVRQRHLLWALVDDLDHSSRAPTTTSTCSGPRTGTGSFDLDFVVETLRALRRTYASEEAFYGDARVLGLAHSLLKRADAEVGWRSSSISISPRFGEVDISARGCAKAAGVDQHSSSRGVVYCVRVRLSEVRRLAKRRDIFRKCDQAENDLFFRNNIIIDLDAGDPLDCAFGVLLARGGPAMAVPPKSVGRGGSFVLIVTPDRQTNAAVASILRRNQWHTRARAVAKTSLVPSAAPARPSSESGKHPPNKEQPPGVLQDFGELRGSSPSAFSKQVLEQNAQGGRTVLPPSASAFSKALELRRILDDLQGRYAPASLFNSWIEISEKKLRKNVSLVRQHLAKSQSSEGLLDESKSGGAAPPPPLLGAVLKINAYSYGMSQAATILADSGVDYFFVERPEEAFHLRTVLGIGAPILLLYRSVLSPALLCRLARLGVSVSALSLNWLLSVDGGVRCSAADVGSSQPSASSRSLGTSSEDAVPDIAIKNIRLKVHVMIDTGLSREGLRVEEAVGGHLAQLYTRRRSEARDAGLVDIEGML